MRIQIRMAKKMAIQEASGKLLIVLLILIKLTNGERNVIKPSEQTTRRLLTKRHNEKDHPPLEFESYDQQSSDQIAPSIQLHQNHHFQQDTAAATPTSLSLISSSHPQLPEPFALVQQQQQQQPSLAASTSGKPLVRTVNPGDRVNIPCSLANMGGSIQFAKDDQPIILDSGCAHCQLDISNDGQASLTINRVSQRDQGHWQCWRLDAHGKVKQKIPIVQLAVTNSPELPILIVNDKELLGGNNLDATITIKENEIVTFKCIIKAASTPVDYVHWILDSSTNVTEMSELRMDYSPLENNYNTQSVLRLNATKAMNMKPISCLSNHQLWLTPMTVTALLNVLYEPSFTISREPGFGVPVSEGMTVILKCEIDSNPSSSPIWIKDADNRTSSAGGQDNSQQQQQQPNQINGKESSAEPIVLDTQDDGSVVFQPVRQSDSAWYRCKTENKYGNFSSFGYYLNVRPAGSSGSQPNGAGAGSSPAQQAQHPSYQRPRSDSRIMGPNQAAAGGGGGPPLASFPAHQMSSLVSSAQQTVRPLLHQDINTNTQRSQLANDQPQPMFGGNQLLAAAHSQAQQASSASSSFDNAELPAAAARCRSNGAPPLGHPEIKSPVMSVQAVLGRQLILPLRFCCQPSPARVFWIHRHLAMIPGRMFGPYITREVYPTYNSAHCYETTFEIEQVKPEDIGTVYVFVSNDKGHAGAQIHIQLAKQLTSSTTTGQSPSDLHNSQFNSMQTNLGSRFQFAPASSSSPSLAGAPQDFIKSKLPFVWLAILMVVATIIQLAATTQNHYQVSEHHHSQPHSTVPRRRDPENPSGVARLIRTPGAQLTDRFASIQRHHHHHDQHHNHHHHSHYHHNQQQHHHHRH